MVADAAIAAEVPSEVATEQSVAGAVPDAVVATLPGVEAGDRCRKLRIITMGAAYRASESDNVKPPICVANKLAVEVMLTTCTFTIVDEPAVPTLRNH